MPFALYVIGLFVVLLAFMGYMQIRYPDKKE